MCLIMSITQPVNVKCQSPLIIAVQLHVDTTHMLIALGEEDEEEGEVDYGVENKIMIRFKLPLKRRFNYRSIIYIYNITCVDIAQWLESRKSNPKTLCLIPWRGRVRNKFSIPPSHLHSGLVAKASAS